jgi:1,4-dihydroxy-2-naphthoyl-CoA hydrolase
VAEPDLVALWGSMPFAADLGGELVEASPERVVAVLAWSERLCTVADALHGGALMALADSAGAVCAFLNLPHGAGGTSTLDSRTSFLRAVRDGTVTATATPLHAGRRVVVVETELRDDAGRLVAKTSQTQTVL